ncbi:MAG TPA: cbb3-type cytochrome oxidase assembly protein CcoS [Rugosibacter sp.]|nr:cbb3-type cytochrome oxidase assembly protein CcoS [Rugosibacter sp.]HQQ35339.1 cbb3-type cytochrome oxidase assembly protein CcoS [Rugosibacter sp.]
MDSLYLLIPISLLIVFCIGLIFWWSLKNGQFDDLEGPGYRVLMDDDSVLMSEDHNARADKEQKSVEHSSHPFSP